MSQDLTQSQDRLGKLEHEDQELTTKDKHCIKQ
jgi:hypothetical protein